MASTNEHTDATQHQIDAQSPSERPAEKLRDTVPKVRFYDFLKINWKFSMGNDYTLLEKPSSNDDIMTYRFASTPKPSSQTVRNALFGITQGFSKNFYKQYTVLVIFEGMSHKEVLDYCSKHQTSPELICILETYFNHVLR